MSTPLQSKHIPARTFKPLDHLFRIYLSMPKCFLLGISCSLLLFFSLPVATTAQTSTPDYTAIAEEWLYAVRTSSPTDSLQQLLSKSTPQDLHQQLNTENKAKAFWINIYNAATQTALKNNPAQYKNRNAFFKAKLTKIAGKDLSLDLIEHGILRRSKNKLSLGYVNKILPGKFEKKFRVKHLDYRIHFALNCGARSCPPIAYYEPDKINEQLQTAMEGHLRTESDYDSVKNKVAVTAFMGWFRADFGGKKGIKKLLQSTGVIPLSSNPKVTFKKYDWDIYLDNFTEE